MFHGEDGYCLLYTSILARGTEVREGSVALVSKSGDIQVAGKIDVSGPKSGGDVLVSGQQVALASTASIDARGAAQMCIRDRTW